MPTILHINASPRYASSDSLRLARHFIDSVQAAGPESPNPAGGSSDSASNDPIDGE